MTRLVDFRAQQLVWLSLTSAFLFLAVDPCTPVSAASSSNHLPIVDKILTRRQAVSTPGPLIAIRSPSVQPTKPIPTIETTTPIRLAVHFMAHGAPVKLQTLEVCGKAWGFQRCFTDKLKPYLNANTNVLDVPNLDIPTGKYIIEIRIADDEGQETVAYYKVAVAGAFKPPKTKS